MLDALCEKQPALAGASLGLQLSIVAPVYDEEATGDRGYWVYDLAEPFDRWASEPIAEFFQEVHYSARGNQVIADALLGAVDPLIRVHR